MPALEAPLRLARDLLCLAWNSDMAGLLAAAPSILLALLLSGAIGRGFGITALFNQGGPASRFASGLGCALVLVSGGFASALLGTGSGAPAPRHGQLAALVFHVLAFSAAVLALGALTAALTSRGQASKDLSAPTPPRDVPGPQRLRLSIALALGLLSGLSVTVALCTLGDHAFAAVDRSPAMRQALAVTGNLLGTAPEWTHWHILAGIAVAALALPVALLPVLGRDAIPAAACVCIALAAVTLVGGAILFAHPPVIPLSVAAFLGLYLGSRARGRYAFRTLAGKDSVPLAETATTRLASWRSATPPPRATTGHVFAPTPSGEHLPALVLLCVSGGGLRAALWTSLVLQRLQAASTTDLPFTRRIRLVCGASGGMLGAAHLLHTLRHRGANALADPAFADALRKECLGSLTRQWVFRDLPSLLLPVAPPNHRGNAFEDHCARNLGIANHVTGFTFGSVASGELDGSLPSLVFSPMMLEDGRRLHFSNLDLDPLTHALAPEIKVPALAGLALASQSAVEARHLLGADAFARLPILSAVRASATFPFIMPISTLPTDPPRGLVDAGYYDNYGTGIATAWIHATLRSPDRLAWLRESCGGILVVQIRDGVLDLTRPLAETAPPDGGHHASNGFLRQAMGPLRAFAGFRSARQLFDNDAALASTADLCSERGIPFNTVSFEFGGSAAMSWALSPDDLASLDTSAASEKVTDRAAAAAAWVRNPA